MAQDWPWQTTPGKMASFCEVRRGRPSTLKPGEWATESGVQLFVMLSGSPREKVEGKQEQAEGTSGSGRTLRIALAGPEGTSASKNLGGGVFLLHPV